MAWTLTSTENVLLVLLGLVLFLLGLITFYRLGLEKDDTSKTAIGAVITGLGVFFILLGTKFFSKKPPKGLRDSKRPQKPWKEVREDHVSPQNAPDDAQIDSKADSLVEGAKELIGQDDALQALSGEHKNDRKTPDTNDGTEHSSSPGDISRERLGKLHE